VNKEALKEQHEKQQKGKATGIDKITKEEYEENLEENLDKITRRMKTFSYRPQAVRRTYIPKANGQLRPLGIPAYEDKLVQGAMTGILNGVYEPRFLECSYGFRPERSCHQAIKEINKTIMTKKVGYIIDADIKGFFDNVDHKWLIKFLENDIQDKNFIRYIVRFLKAGIIEDLKYYESDKGTPQGGLISPILANVYLHYVLDTWFEKGIKPKLQGEAYLVRYADDFIIMLQYENEAKKVYEVLKKRLTKFGLELAEDKTRIIPFGRFKGTTETFDFLGFTHINGKTRESGKYVVKHKTSKKKMKAKKEAVKIWIKDNMHKPISSIMETLKKKLAGHYNYYGISGNSKDIYKFYVYTKDRIYKTLNKRTQKNKMKWWQFNRIWEGFGIPQPKIKVSIYA
jgi:group II intron reverse transcriptase/maturase